VRREKPRGKSSLHFILPTDLLYKVISPVHTGALQLYIPPLYRYTVPFHGSLLKVVYLENRH
jgi:hypothetical protein